MTASNAPTQRPRRGLAAVVVVLLASMLLAASPAGASSAASRTAGRPTSANGASSMQLRFPPGQVGTEASATLSVITQPRTADIYFWALQVNFLDARNQTVGSAHLGLQWHPGHPNSKAVNWGGYAADGSELRGTASALPSRTGNVNTRDFTWARRAQYQLRVVRAAGGWRGEVVHLASGRVTDVRTLHVAAERVQLVGLFTESFAPCDARTSTVRWTGVKAGLSMQATYQDVASGACTNTNQRFDGIGFRQQTAITRRVPALTTMRLPF